MKKEKNKNSDTKKIDPGKPKNISKLSKDTRNNFGHIKLTPLISVKSLVLKRLVMASTSRKELVDSKAWLINIQKLANIRLD